MLSILWYTLAEAWMSQHHLPQCVTRFRFKTLSAIWKKYSSPSVEYNLAENAFNIFFTPIVLIFWIFQLELYPLYLFYPCLCSFVWSMASDSQLPIKCSFKYWLQKYSDCVVELSHKSFFERFNMIGWRIIGLLFGAPCRSTLVARLLSAYARRRVWLVSTSKPALIDQLSVDLVPAALLETGLFGYLGKRRSRKPFLYEARENDTDFWCIPITD